MKIKNRFLRRVILLSLVQFILGNSSCENIMTQNPKELFASGKLPRQLEMILNQKRELSLKDKERMIRRELQDEKNREKIVRIGVIDSGVSNSHRLLKNKSIITLNEEKNEIIGIGYDLISGLPFGSNIYIDPVLFSFGAKEISKNGLIVEELSNPLELVKQINERFVYLVLSGIQKSENLQQSLFSRLGPKSFTFLGFADEMKYYDLSVKSYEENLKENKLISLKNINIVDEHWYGLKQTLNRNWSEYQSSKDQKCSPLSYISQIEYGDEFLKLIKTSLDVIDDEFKLKENKQKIRKFMKIKKYPKLESDDLDKKVTEVLENAVHYAVQGIDQFDPIIQIEKLFKSHPLYKDKNTRDAIDSFIKDQELRLDNINLDSVEGAETKKLFKNGKEYLNQIKSLLYSFLEIKSDPNMYRSYRSNARRYFVRTQHPYIDKNTLSNEHATHVSDSIVVQHPKLRYFPIRATTQSIQLSEDSEKEKIQLLLKDFENWTKSSSIYYQPLKELITKEFGIKNAPSEKTILKQLENYLKSEPLTAVFVNDVFKGIEVAGANNLHVSNVSLGMTFKKPYGESNKEGGVAIDLFSEFVRFKMGEKLRDSAPRTIFVISSGNDGDALDGISKTGFPAQIVSPRLDQICNDKNLPATANNTVKNIIAVASVNKQGLPTEFANVMSEHLTNLVASTGEERTAAVPGKGLTISEKLTAKAFRNAFLFYSELIMKTLKNDNYLDVTPEKELSRDALEVDSEMWSKLNELTVLSVHLSEGTIDTDEMSGTSMSSPAVAGFVGKYLAESIESGLVKASEIGVKPGWTAGEVVERVKLLADQSPVYRALIIQPPRLTKIKEEKKSKNYRRQEKWLKKATSKSKNYSCRHFYL